MTCELPIFVIVECEMTGFYVMKRYLHASKAVSPVIAGIIFGWETMNIFEAGRTKTERVVRGANVKKSTASDVTILQRACFLDYY